VSLNKYGTDRPLRERFFVLLQSIDLSEVVDPSLAPTLAALTAAEREQILEVMRRDAVIRLHNEIRVR